MEILFKQKKIGVTLHYFILLNRRYKLNENTICFRNINIYVILSGFVDPSNPWGYYGRKGRILVPGSEYLCAWMRITMQKRGRERVSKPLSLKKGHSLKEYPHGSAWMVEPFKTTQGSYNRWPQLRLRSAVWAKQTKQVILPSNAAQTTLKR